MVARLEQAIDRGSGKRFQLLYGPGVSDAFIDHDLREKSIEEALLDELIHRNYERIIFISPHRSIYFLDNRSRNLAQPNRSTPTPITPTRQMRHLSDGPLNSLMLIEPQSQSAPVQSLEEMGDTLTIRFLNTMMRDETIKTAIIFIQVETVLSHFENPRILSGLIGEWTRLLTTNPNTCFLLFAADTYEQLNDLVNRLSVPELRSMILERAEKSGVHALLLVGGPDFQEIVRLVKNVSQTTGLRIEQEETFKMFSWMAAEGLNARQWLIRLKGLEKLDLSILQAQGWLSSFRDLEKTALEQLETLVGLDEIKQRLKEWNTWLNVTSSKKKRFGEVSPSLHMVFMGSPGTGKTTVARLMGELLHEAGILRRGHLVEVSSGDLIAEHVGGTAIKTNSMIDQALDGVLFIDEAYALAEPDRGGFGQEALETILVRLENDRDRLIMILAGYPGKMTHLLDSNPGLSRRFPRENIFNFPDYSPEELWEILQQMLKGRNLIPSPEVEKELQSILRGLHSRRDENFGNAGEMRNLSDGLERRHAVRVHDLDLPLETKLEKEDVPIAYREAGTGEQVSLEQILKELDGLVGLGGVKQHIQMMTVRIQYENLRRKLSPDFPLSSGLDHMIFTGNPGTGKTTVARLMGKIYHSLGYLRRGHCVEISRSELVAGYVGQTAIRTKKYIREALDGILFIDEVYSLNNSPEDSFGRECVDTLVKAMEDYRGRFVVIAAGYPEQVEGFLQSNPGLRSRFSINLHFDDLSSEESVEVLRRLAEKEVYILPDPVLDNARILIGLIMHDPHSFGNARFLRTFFEQMKLNLADRLIKKTGGNLEECLPDELVTFKVVDLPGFQEETEESSQPSFTSISSILNMESNTSALTTLKSHSNHLLQGHEKKRL